MQHFSVDYRGLPMCAAGTDTAFGQRDANIGWTIFRRGG